MKNIIVNHLLALILMLLIISCTNYGEKITIGQTDIYYTEQVTKEQAEKTGEILTETGFLTEGKSSLRLVKENNTYALQLIIQKENFNKLDDDQLSLMKLLGTVLSEEIFNKDSVQIQICDDTFNSYKTLEMYDWNSNDSIK